MLRITQPLLAAVLALVVVAITATGASAYRSLTIERSGAIRQASQGKITFSGALVLVACDLTLSGNVRSGPYTLELPIVVGEVTRLEWRECTGGNIIEILGLPWAIRIERITESERAPEARIAGIKPEKVTGFLVSLVESGRGRLPTGFSLELLAIECLYGGRGENPGALMPLGNQSGEGPFSYTLEALTVLEGVRFRKSSGLETCPGEGIIRGRFNPAEPARTAIFQ